MKQCLTILCILVFLVFGGMVFVQRLDFKQNCSGRLERAATANTVELAMAELEDAIQYAEQHNYTSGYTSVLYRTPDEDVEFWYNNLVASYNELQNLSDETTTLEKTNTLMKLGETLTENGESGTKVIYPDGLEFYPHNIFWGIVRWLFILSIVGFMIIFQFRHDF